MRLAAQIDFLLACDQLKQVQRTTFLFDGSRAENSAEHSWHLALMALTLAEYAPPDADINRVLRLLLVHDLVEIYAGDTHFDTDAAGKAAQQASEVRAAEQLFALLPPDQQALFHDLWQEFEAQETPEARFAKALDALQPMLLTWGQTAGGVSGVGCAESYPELTRQRVLTLKEPRLQEFPALWKLAQDLLKRAEQNGLFV